MESIQKGLSQRIGSTVEVSVDKRA